MTSANDKFQRFGASVAIASILTTAISLIGLLVVNLQFVPVINPITNELLSGMSNSWFQFLQNFLGGLFSIGVVGLVYEFFLRRNYASDLSHYLNLKTSIVTSGLQQLSEDRQVDWDAFLGSASHVTAQLVEPQRWLQRHLETMLDSARLRPVKVTIALPDPQGSDFSKLARTIGIAEAELESRIQAAVTEIEARFESARSELKKGTVFKVSSHPKLALFEIVVTEERAAILLNKVSDAIAGDARLAIVFKQDKSQYPTSWLHEQVAAVAGYPAISQKEKR